MKRREFPASVRVARLKHASANGVLCCEGCGVMMKPGEFAFDHDLADALGGKPTFANCRVLCIAQCHATKTAMGDVPTIAKAKRREAAHIGAATPAKARIQSQGFRQKAKREPRVALPPRRLFEPRG